MPWSVDKSSGDAGGTDPSVLLYVVKKHLRQAEGELDHLSRLLSTPSGTDRLLSLIYYSSTFLAPQLSRLALLLTVKLATPIPLVVLTPASTTLATASNRLRKLASKISDVRMFMRLWGLVGIYKWGAGTLRSPPKDAVVRSLVLAQVAVNAAYQVLENMAYLNMHSLLAFSKRTEGRMWLWSTRCWAAHIVLDFVKLERMRWLRNEKARGLRGLVVSGEEERAARDDWNKAWVCNATTAPLSIHWSLEKGLLDDTAVGAFGCVGAAISLRDAWRGCA
ncbi:hypothetical protein BZA05DRAFT_421244 [Tricharina praecox]|uniref:uncharacterized protein n=1 Tax=Tricharina praecox TaxID=43433 RepID=UPI002220DB12|nr:uncharacterized protein BZA05DRAFT_421244 [Tricharina praecox]KAI5845998.1 hypothetical protein BZA05DRAFT_421244 [Tricharina praecox]